MPTPSTIFSSFAGKFPLSKTLRFALLPQGNTLANFQSHKVLQHDEQRKKDYQTIKPLFDTLHETFIQQSLEKSQIDWSVFFTFYTTYLATLKHPTLSEKEKTDLKAEFSSYLAKLRKEIVALYTTTAEQWKANFVDTKGKPLLKGNGYNILTENGILEVLKKEYETDSEKKQVITNFKGFFTYFKGFNENRKNYYSDEEKATAVSYRIVNENLLFFCDNILLRDKLVNVELTDEEKQIFDSTFYNRCLTQEGIERYNALLGGYENAQGKKVQGINEKINRYEQKHKVKLPKLKTLYKCIGAKTEKMLPFEYISDDEELKNALTTMIARCDTYLPRIVSLIIESWQNEEELTSLWISKNSLSRLSNRYLKNRYAFAEQGIALKIFKENKKDEEKVNIPAYVSLAEVKQILEHIPYEDQSSLEKDKRNYLFKPHLEEQRNGETNNRKFLISLIISDIKSYYDTPRTTTDNENNTIENNYLQEKAAIQSFLPVLDKTDTHQKTSIKNLGDQALFLLRFLKLFKVAVDKLSGEQLSEKYNDIDRIITEFSLTQQYDAIRNYLTQKPFSEEKIKLNFDCSTLLDGRDVNKENQNLGVILRENGKWFLAIMHKEYTTLFDPKKTPTLYETPDTMEKLEYKLLPGPNKMLPKCLMPGKDRKKYGATDEILSLYDKGLFKKGKDFDNNALHQLIDFYKSALPKYTDWRVFNFQFKPTEQYEDISQFYAEVEQQGYKLSRKKINSQLLHRFVEEGKCYLFEISCKDFKHQHLTSKDNLQTIYWKTLFQPHSNVKLNGEAEIFFRKASLQQKQPIITNENNYTIKNEKAIKSGRYTEDKFLLHCPITLHFGTKAEGKFNQRINQHFLAHQDQMHIIGVDRGEKHLNFYSVIDMQGNIVEQGTLNVFTYDDGKGGKRIVNYETLLSNKADERKNARQNRDTINSIKELKNGYISQVVHRLAQLVLKYNAVIVLEDLNGGFKRGRQKIEKSVYQNLELALAKKFGYLVLKDTPLGEPGSATNAYQLCPLVNSFGDIKGKQRGVLFYTRANYTSITDPVSGRRRHLYFSKKTGEEMRKQVVSFTAMGYDEKKSEFFFTYNPAHFSAEGKGLSKEWTLWSGVERWRKKRDEHGIWADEKVKDITEALRNLFTTYGITLSNDILSQIREKADLEAKFYSELLWLLEIIMQIRNTDNQKNDFILSPIEVGGKKFDSREYYERTKQTVHGTDIFEMENTQPLPTSGDANGAFNIARKGILMLKRIQENPEKPNVLIRDEEWDKYNLS